MNDLQSLMRDRLASEQPDLDALIAVATRRGRRQRTARRLGAGLAVAAVVAAGCVGTAAIAAGHHGTTAQIAASGPSQPTAKAGALVVGPADAPHHVTIYEDLLAPYSAQLADSSYGLLQDAAEAGRLQITYRPMALLVAANTGTYSTQALAALDAVEDLAGTDAALAYQDALFKNQPPEGGPYPSLAELAQEAGQVVPAQDRQQVETAIEQQTYKDLADSTTRQDESAGVLAVPDIALDGKPFPRQSTWPNTGSALLQAVAAPLSAGAEVTLPSGGTMQVAGDQDRSVTMPGMSLIDKVDGLALVLPDKATKEDITYLLAAYEDKGTELVSAPKGLASVVGGDTSVGGDDAPAKPETKPASPSLAGWTCGEAGDDKFICTGPDGKQAEFVWYPADQYATWTSGDPDKTAPYISTVHDGVFMTIRIDSLGNKATAADAEALGESLVWK